MLEVLPNLAQGHRVVAPWIQEYLPVYSELGDGSYGYELPSRHGVEDVKIGPLSNLWPILCHR